MSSGVLLQNNLNQTICEGSIINAYLILTAAKCVLNYKEFDSKDSIKVIAGLDESKQFRNVLEIFCHQDYEPGLILNNVAILLLEEPFDLNRFIQRIQFPEHRDDVPDLATTSGWGILTYGSTPKILKRRRFQTNSTLGRTRILENIICSGNSSDGSCIGYMGGPIMCKSRRTQTSIICGIHNFHFGASQNDESYPNIYTEIIYFMDWIKSKSLCLCNQLDWSLVGQSCNVDYTSSSVSKCETEALICDENEVKCYDTPNGRCIPNGKLGVKYRVYVQGKGWQKWAFDGQVAGLPEEEFGIEALEVKLINSDVMQYIYSAAKLENSGWQNWTHKGVAGKPGKNESIQRFRFKFGRYGNDEYDFYKLRYSFHFESVGWVVDTNLGKDNFDEGNLNQVGRLRAIRLKILKNYDDCGCLNPVPTSNLLWETVKFTLNISYISGSPDGVHTPNILTANGRFPAETIRVKVGDVLEVRVINSIQDGQNTTIHWHGVHQAGTPFEDGPNLVTQCPIKAGTEQIYKFPVKHAGTYWYHSHVNSQYTEGLWGPLIVHNEKEYYSYNAELMITLTEWYHHSAKENEEWHLSLNSSGAPPYPNSGLMNGHGRYNCSNALLENRTCNEAAQLRPVFHLNGNEEYRLRLLNIGGWATYNFTIDGHTLSVVEVDGIEVERPTRCTAIFLSTGQRYSIILDRNPGEVVSDYVIRATIRTEYFFTLDGNINRYKEYLLTELTGVLRYVPTGNDEFRRRIQVSKNLWITEIVPEFEICSYKNDIPARDRREGELRFLGSITPTENVPAPEFYDEVFTLNLTFITENGSGIRRAAFNFKPFTLPFGKPLLVKMLNNEVIPESAPSLVVKYGSVVQLIINNDFEGPHPIHLHGHHFWVVA